MTLFNNYFTLQTYYSYFVIQIKKISWSWSLLHSLCNDFKGIGPSIHVDKIKPLVGFNSIISCKNNAYKTYWFFYVYTTFLPAIDDLHEIISNSVSIDISCSI